jgi:hypothetical protein
VIGLLAAALVVLAPSENHSGACTTAEPDGVTVVIDYQGLGGGTQATCALGLGSGANGRSALSAIGASTQGTAHDGDAFVCRLNGRPSASEVLSLPSGDYQETCENTPPSNAYWSYWYADNGGSWTYSTSGAGQHRVKAGGFEGWSFNLGGANAPAPRFAPAKVAAPAPVPPAGGNGSGAGSDGRNGNAAAGADGGGAAGSGQGGDAGGGRDGSGGAGGSSGSGAEPDQSGADGGADSGGGIGGLDGDTEAGLLDQAADPTGPDGTDDETGGAATGEAAGPGSPGATGLVGHDRRRPGALGERTGRPQAVALGGIVGGSVAIMAALGLVHRRSRRLAQSDPGVPGPTGPPAGPPPISDS